MNYKYRMHDPRIGRFFAVDPLAGSYPHNSPYAFSENSTIAFVELEGLERFYAADGRLIGKIGEDDAIRVINNEENQDEFIEAISNINNGLKSDNVVQQGLASLSSYFLIAKSAKLSESSGDVIKAVTHTIYDDLKLGDKYAITDVQFFYVDGRGATMDPKTAVLSINDKFEIEEGDKAIDGYNYISNIIFHEAQHLILAITTGSPYGLEGKEFDIHKSSYSTSDDHDHFGHFAIWRDQAAHSSYKKLSEKEATHIERFGLGYLDAQYKELSNQLWDGTTAERRALFESDDFQRTLKKYKENVNYFLEYSRGGGVHHHEENASDANWEILIEDTEPAAW